MPVIPFRVCMCLLALNIILVLIRPSYGIAESKIENQFHLMDTRYSLDFTTSRGYEMKNADIMPIQPNGVFEPISLRRAREKEDGKDCKDDHPYCDRFVYTYGTDTPFTLCDEEWFISKQGMYGCRLSCKLC